MRLFQWLRGRQQQTINEAPESRIMTLSERSYLEDAPYMVAALPQADFQMLERARIENTNPRGTSVSPVYFAIGQRSG